MWANNTESIFDRINRMERIIFPLGERLMAGPIAWHFSAKPIIHLGFLLEIPNETIL